MTPKAEEYEKAGYHVVEHKRERNGVAGNLGYYIYYINSLYQEPFFLAEWENLYATARTKEDVVDALRFVVMSSKS